MEPRSKLDAATNAIDSLVYATGPTAVGASASAAAGAAPNSARTSPTRGRYAPDDRQALLERLQTFRPATWFGKPDVLSPQACALRGWRNVAPDRVSCEFCGAKVACMLPQGTGESARAAARRFAQLLTDNHAEFCPWRSRPSPRTLLSFAPMPASQIVADFDRRDAALQRLDRLPDLSAGTLRQLLLQAAVLLPAAPPSAGEAAAAAAAASSSIGVSLTSQAEAAEAALALLLGVTHQQLAALKAQQQGPAASGGGSGGCTLVLPFSGAAHLLALLGWEAKELPRSAQGGASSSNSTPGAHGLRVAAAAPQQAPASGRESCAHVSLHCGMCAASCGLWSFGGTGQLPGSCKVQQSRAARLAVASKEQLLALHQQQQRQRQKQREQQQGEEQGPVAGADDIAPLEQPQDQQQQEEEWMGWLGAPRQDSAPGEVALSLTRTIAGGDLISPASALGGPFGGGAFGGGLFGSGSGGVTPFGSPPAPAPAFSTALAAAPVNGSAPPAAPAFGSASLEAAAAGAGSTQGAAARPLGSPPAEPSGSGKFGGSEPVFGLGAIDAEVQRRRRSGSASGAARGGRGSGSVVVAPLPPPVRVLDAAGAGGRGAAKGGLQQRLLDPIGLHRSWCPWVLAASDNSISSASSPAAASTVPCGWLYCLLALHESRGSTLAGAGTGGSAGGTGSAAADGTSGDGWELHMHVDARGVEEDVRRSRAAMAAKVRAAIDALEGA